MDTAHTGNKSDSGLLNIVLFSFGFKHGVPVDANLLFDVRFLPNPYWQEELRPQTGLDKSVAEFVVESDSGAQFLELLKPLLRMVAVQSAGIKKDLRIGIGCTGGRHRSVAVVEALAKVLIRNEAVNLLTQHRDIDKDDH